MSAGASLFYPIVGLIACTVAASLFLDNGLTTLPYFPIEISRMLATGIWATRTFQVYLGLVLLYYMYYFNVWHLAIGACVVGISIFDDKQYYEIHMAFVAAMIGLVVARVYDSPDKLVVVGSALALYGLRLAIKGTAVLVQERAGPGLGLLGLISRTQQMMMDGQGATPATLVLLKLGGVIQWLVFALFGTQM
jgi:hypothetical protein